MTIHKALHSKDNIDKLEKEKKEFACIEDNVDTSIWWLEDNIKK